MFHWRNYAAQNVIYAFEILDFFKSDDVFGFFDNANRGRFASCANVANLVFGIVAADFAKVNVLFHFAYCVDKFVHFVVGRIENRICITRRRLFADGRKFG